MSLRFGKPRYRPDRDKWELPVYDGSKRKRPLFDSKRAALEFMSRPEVDENAITIEHAIQDYFSKVSSHKSRSSHSNEQRYFNLMFHFFIEERGLHALTQVKYGHVLELQKWLCLPRDYDDKPMHWSTPTVNRAFNSIKDFFVYWVREGELEASPCAHLATLPEVENARRSMTGDEYLQAFDKAPAWFKPAMAFMHLTASAGSSVARLKWSDIESENVIITRRKGAKSRWRRMPFPLTDELKAILGGQFRERHGFVFSNESGKPLTGEWCSRVGNRAIRAAGLKGVVLYGMRHALASELTDENVSMEIIRRLMGHANIRTTQRYAKPKTESLGAALTLVRGGKCHPAATSDKVDENLGNEEVRVIS